MATVANDPPRQAQDLPTYGLALRELLDVESLAGSRVLAGGDGLDRLVSGLNVMEVPDVLAWVKPHELVLTTGFPLRRPGHALDAGAFVTLLEGMAAQGLAGFAIKLGRYVEVVPAEVLAVADALSFPVVQLGPEVAFDDVLRQAYAALNRFQASVLEQIDALHAALTMIVLEGGDLEQIAAEVARVLSVGIVITSTDGREWAGCASERERATLSEAGLVDDTGRLRVERARGGAVPFGGGDLRVLHVAASGAELARLLAFSDQRALRPSDVYSLERAATVAALLITRQQAVNAVENKYRGDFLRDVFQARAGSADYVTEHAAGLGWSLERPSVVVVAQLDPDPPGDAPVSGRTRRGYQDRFAAAWRQVVEARNRGTPVADFSAEVVALLPVDDDRLDAAAVVQATLAAVRGDRGGGRRSFSAGISRVVRGVDGLPEAYGHARKAVEVGRRMNGAGSTTFFDALGIRRLLSLVPDDAELTGFAREVLGPLADDTPAADDLRTTMQVLLDANLNVAESARLQHFHYNTMRYRVAKLERLLGPFSSDPRVRLDIAVALQIQQMAT